MYRVVVLDSRNNVAFAITTLMAALRLDHDRALALVETIYYSGRCVVWAGPLAGALAVKAALQSRAEHGVGPLLVVIE